MPGILQGVFDPWTEFVGVRSRPMLFNARAHSATNVRKSSVQSQADVEWTRSKNGLILVSTKRTHLLQVYLVYEYLKENELHAPFLECAAPCAP